MKKSFVKGFGETLGQIFGVVSAIYIIVYAHEFKKNLKDKDETDDKAEKDE